MRRFSVLRFLGSVDRPFVQPKAEGYEPKN
jgi:hypothetical protein